MLTKEGRAAIAERLHECDYLYDNALYQILFGHNVPSDTTFEDDSKAILERLANLIDPTCRIYYTDTSTSTPDRGYNPDGYYSCSSCGELDSAFEYMWDDYQASGYEGELPFRYCPHCGARVVRDE